MFFESYKPKVFREEFRRLKSELVSRGFSQTERDRIEAMFFPDLEETNPDDDGIDAAEIARTIDWMRKNKLKHHLSDRKIDILESELKERL